MAEWVIVVELVAVIAVGVVVLPLLWLFFRRRWLSRRGGTFECCLRVVDSDSDHETGDAATDCQGVSEQSRTGSGWVLGIARYSGKYLQWFRAFSLSFRPRKVFDRDMVQIIDHRDPSLEETGLLSAGQKIVELRRVDNRSWELAMCEGSLTGLLSWIEASPPTEPTL